MNEKTLVAQLKSGGSSALGRTIEAYSGYVRTVARNFSRGMLKNEDIDEITADVFYKLYTRRGELDGEIGLRPYLSVMTKNAVKNRFRRLGSCTGPLPEDISELYASNSESVEDAAERSDMMRCLADGIGTLPEDEREIFVRFYFYGERSAAIAEKMRMTENGVNTKLHRIRGKLKAFLIERGFDHA